MTEVHERRQCATCGTFWPGDVDTCPICGLGTFPYTIEVNRA